MTATEDESTPEKTRTMTGTTETDVDAGSIETRHTSRYRRPWHTERAKARARLGAFLRHEWTLAALAALALGAFINRGAWADPRHTLPEDLWDPSLISYLISWGGHALLHQPGQLWQMNSFYPESYSFAFSDTLLGYAPFAFIGTGPEDAVLRYNIIFTFAGALTFFGGYALLRQLGAGRAAAAVAGVAVTVAPWRFGQAGHLHIYSTGGILLALAMLARGHGFRWANRPPEPRIRPAWAVAGWLVAAWQITIGFGIGLVFIYVLLGVSLVSLVVWLVRHRGWPGWALVAADTVGGLTFAAVSLLMALPYLKVLDLYPESARGLAQITVYSPPLRGFFTAPPESAIWGDLHASSRALLPAPAEMDLLPGFALYGLALAGLFVSIWSVRARLLLLAGVVASIALGMGARGPANGRIGYVWLLEHLPGFEGLRTPGRLIVWTTLLLAILAAGAVGALMARVRRRSDPGAPRLAWLAGVVPLVLVFTEGVAVTPHPVMPSAPPAISTVTAPYLVLPAGGVTDAHVMLWSSDRFAPVVNGYSGFTPAEQAQTRRAMAGFPDPSSVARLREIGVKSVVVVRAMAPKDLWTRAADTPLDGLGMTREVRSAVIIFELSPS